MDEGIASIACTDIFLFLFFYSVSSFNKRDKESVCLTPREGLFRVATGGGQGLGHEGQGRAERWPQYTCTCRSVLVPGTNRIVDSDGLVSVATKYREVGAGLGGGGTQITSSKGAKQGKRERENRKSERSGADACC